MSITKKLQNKKAQWKEFVRCMKMLRDASAVVARAEDKIHLKKSYHYDIEQAGWDNGSCMVTHVYPSRDEFGGMVNKKYRDVCEHFEYCKCAYCVHHQDWRDYRDAKKSYELAKIAFQDARKKLFAKLK